MSGSMMKNMKPAISNVLETMFFQPVQFIEKNCTLGEWFSKDQPLIGATLSFTGPVAGSYYFIIPTKMANKITANFLGFREEEISEAQERDTVKEALNMIGGHMLSLFDGRDVFQLGIPELIPENDLDMSKLGDPNGDIVFIKTEETHLAAGITLN